MLQVCLAVCECLILRRNLYGIVMCAQLCTHKIVCAGRVCVCARAHACALCAPTHTHTQACVCRYYRQNRIERLVNTPQLLRLDTFVDIVCQQFLGREAIEYLGGDEPNFPSADNACYIRYQNLTYLWTQVQCEVIKESKVSVRYEDVPIVLPWMSKPSRPLMEKLCSRTRAYARGILRTTLSNRPTAISATAYGL
jgi:hypothetical protein